MSADDPQVFDGALLADNGFKNYSALNASLLGQRRVRRLHLTDQVGLLNISPHSNPLWGLRGRWWGRRRCHRRWSSSQNSTQDAPDLSARDAARNTAYNTTHLGLRRRPFIYDLSHGLGNFHRSAEGAVVHYSFHNLLGYSRRWGGRWRRWRRWRGHQGRELLHGARQGLMIKTTIKTT